MGRRRIVHWECWGRVALTIATVKIFEPVLVQVVCVGMTVEVVCQRVLNPILVMGILKRTSGHVEW